MESVQTKYLWEGVKQEESDKGGQTIQDFSGMICPEKLLLVGIVGLLFLLFLFHLLVGASGVLSERDGAEDYAKAKREYENFLHAGCSPVEI
jgi:hypothetical protein